MSSPFVTLQYVLPHHLISRVVMVATRVKFGPVKNWMIGMFMRGFKPDLSDAVEEDPFAYASFNAFFTRALKPSARPLAGNSRVLLSPVDGILSQSGTIRGGKLLQAKGHQYSLDTLLAGAAIDWSARFRNGRFATIYLAPSNYHRIHMPATGTLEDAWYVPGRLFSVNQAAAAQIPNLFARNERVVLLFKGDFGPFAVILIGALNVGSMATVWHGDVTPRQPRRMYRPAPAHAGAAHPAARRRGWPFQHGFHRHRAVWQGCGIAVGGIAARAGPAPGAGTGSGQGWRRRERQRRGLSDNPWRPSAAIDTLRRRAALLQSAREFFRERGVLEVETPVLLSATVTDPQIASLQVDLAPPRYLHTSPEYPMKRLLAAGSGDIYQVCHAFRAGERSRTHNPEFTLIEWYRSGFDLQQIMAETAALIARLLAMPGDTALGLEFLEYNDAFRRELGCDALATPTPQLAQLCAIHGLAAQAIDSAERDDLLDFLIATQVGPRLGAGKITCLHHYPASQAALAQLDAADPRTALRFEVYVHGLELANGFVELAHADEQQARFTADRAQRARRRLPDVEADARLLAALAAGLPDCAGVALGFDRVAMLATGATTIDEVMAFPWERA